MQIIEIPKINIYIPNTNKQKEPKPKAESSL